MKVAVIGTGVVGQALAGRLAEPGHEVVVGTRNLEATMARAEPDAMGNPPYPVWAHAHPKVPLATFAEAAAHAELVVNATSGGVSIAALRAFGHTDVIDLGDLSTARGAESVLPLWTRLFGALGVAAFQFKIVR